MGAHLLGDARNASFIDGTKKTPQNDQKDGSNSAIVWPKIAQMVKKWGKCKPSRMCTSFREEVPQGSALIGGGVTCLQPVWPPAAGTQFLLAHPYPCLVDPTRSLAGALQRPVLFAFL